MAVESIDSDVSDFSFQSILSGDGADRGIPSDLMDDLKLLLYKHRDGFNVESDIRTQYYEKFKRELVLPAKFRSTNELLDALASIEFIEITHNINGTRSIVPTEKLIDSVFFKIRNKPVDKSKIFIGGSVRSLMPKDAVGRQIGVQSLPDGVQVFDTFEAYMAHVYTPAKFYIQLRSMGAELDRLMDKLSEFYSDPANSARMRIPCLGMNRNLTGLMVAALYVVDGNSRGWHRARITALINPCGGQVALTFVDYGTEDTAYLCHLRFLHADFGHLPCQAILGELAGIRPKSKTWSREASAKFLEMSVLTNKAANAGVVAQIYDFGDEKLELCLFDTTTNDLPFGIVFNDVLIKEGMAVRSKKWTRECGLVPFEYPYQQRDQRNMKREREEKRVFVERTRPRIDTTFAGMSEGKDVTAWLLNSSNSLSADAVSDLM